MKTLTIARHENNVYDTLPASLKEAITILAKLTWAADAGLSDDNAPEHDDAWNKADTYLRAHGIYPVYA